MVNAMAHKIFGRKVGSTSTMTVLFESEGVSSRGKPSELTPQIVDFALSNLRRSVEMLQEKNVEGYVLFAGDTTHYTFIPNSDFELPNHPLAKNATRDLSYLDDIARDAWEGNYERVGVLSTGEVLYVALASGRMRELAPGDSIAYAVDRVGSEWMAHMLQVWRGTSQPKN